MADAPVLEMVEQFKSRDIAKRMTAVSRAAELATPEAVALLVKALQDQSWSLREHAVACAARAGGAAVPSLVRLLAGGVWFARSSAARVLAATGDARAVAALAEQASDGNATVAREAAAALAAVLSRTGREEALARLAGLPAAERERAMPGLTAADPELASRLRQEPDRSDPGPAGREQADASAARLQGLRKALKAALRQDARDDDEEP